MRSFYILYAIVVRLRAHVLPRWRQIDARAMAHSTDEALYNAGLSHPPLRILYCSLSGLTGTASPGGTGIIMLPAHVELWTCAPGSTSTTKRRGREAASAAIRTGALLPARRQ